MYAACIIPEYEIAIATSSCGDLRILYEKLSIRIREPLSSTMWKSKYT